MWDSDTADMLFMWLTSPWEFGRTKGPWSCSNLLSAEVSLATGFLSSQGATPNLWNATTSLIAATISTKFSRPRLGTLSFYDLPPLNSCSTFWPSHWYWSHTALKWFIGCLFVSLLLWSQHRQKTMSFILVSPAVPNMITGVPFIFFEQVCTPGYSPLGANYFVIVLLCNT